MKTTQYLKSTLRLLIAVFCFGIFQNVTAQDAAPVYFELTTWKYTDLSRDLIATVMTENDEGEIPAQGLTIKYYVMADGDAVEIGQAISNEKGIATLTLGRKFEFPKDDDDYVNIYAVYEGDDNYEPAEAELMFKDVVINLEFVEEDGEKYIAYEGKIIDKNGELQPLADDDVYFYVPRMFSFLKIADGWFEEDGKGVVEYPANIIGDTLGQLEVHARLLEHFDYGNVERIATVTWAKPRRQIAAEQPSRELWTPIAPLWMIITLIILLAGVWGHYIYAMYELYMIKKIAKREAKNKNAS